MNRSTTKPMFPRGCLITDIGGIPTPLKNKNESVGVTILIYSQYMENIKTMFQTTKQIIRGNGLMIPLYGTRNPQLRLAEGINPNPAVLYFLY